jgi:hypothetical protein
MALFGLQLFYVNILSWWFSEGEHRTVKNTYNNAVLNLKYNENASTT